MGKDRQGKKLCHRLAFCNKFLFVGAEFERLAESANWDNRFNQLVIVIFDVLFARKLRCPAPGS